MPLVDFQRQGSLLVYLPRSWLFACCTSMPATVGPTSPLPGAQGAKGWVHMKPSIAALLSAAPSGTAALAAGNEPAAACVAKRQQPPGKRRPARSVLSRCSSEDVYAAFDFYSLRHPCLSKEYEAAADTRAVKRHLWAKRHAAAVDHAASEHRRSSSAFTTPWPSFLAHWNMPLLASRKWAAPPERRRCRGVAGPDTAPEKETCRVC